MNRQVLFTLVFTGVISVSQYASAQQISVDSLRSLLVKVSDTDKIKTMLKIASQYGRESEYDTALSYRFQALQLAEKIQNKESIFLCLMELAEYYESNGKPEQALGFALRAEKIALDQGSKRNLFNVYNLIGGFIYFNQGNYDKSLAYGLQMLKIAEGQNNKWQMIEVQSYMGDVYRAQKKFDDALSSYAKALKAIRESGDKAPLPTCLNNIAVIYEAQDQYDKALDYYLEALSIAKEEKMDIADYLTRASEAYRHLNKIQQADEYAMKALAIFEKNGELTGQIDAYSILEKTGLARNDFKNAYTYLKKKNNLKDSLDLNSLQNSMAAFQEKYTLNKKNAEIDFLQNKARLQLIIRNILIGSSLLLLAIAFLITKQYRQKKKSQAEQESKNSELVITLTELKSAQSQLVQSEKMASLGVLTAGIAHEIQNPLNFVNNFSEVNTELIAEMKDEMDKGNMKDAKAIANDVAENEQKILLHGKRADAIVKGMLQHSRTSTAVREPTDINKLADEYLHLAYHGLRAKDKSFNATLIPIPIGTEYDETLEKIDIIPQDIGRVILNLITNAFYATNEKQKQNVVGYEPMVIISTERENDKVRVSVKDNGNGIPQKIVDKIFQPFFTTKPTGQGTGLGLSLSYDIIKAHGGEIKVNTVENEGTEFIISLPL